MMFPRPLARDFMVLQRVRTGLSGRYGWICAKRACGLMGSLSKDGGKTWSPNQLVYASPDGHICECCHPTAYVGPKGELYAMWRNWLGGSRDMYYAVSTDGKSWRPISSEKEPGR